MRHCGIAMRIFLPVLAVLVIFPLAAFGIFGLTSGWYMERVAENQVNELTAWIQKEAEETAGFCGDDSAMSEETARERARELIRELRRLNKKAQVFVFDSRLALVYPSGTDTESVSVGAGENWRNILKEGALSADAVRLLEIDGQKYAARFYQTATEYRIKCRYFVIYKRVMDASWILSQAGGLILILTAALLAACGAAVWGIARSIAEPIRLLCEQTARVGSGAGGERLRSERFSVRELEVLRREFCAMEERLRRSEEEKQRIFQNISHDLRTPLASIIGYSEGLSRGAVREPEKAVGIILAESRRMNRMVDQVLTLSRLDSNAWPVRKLKLPLVEFLDEQLDILRGLAGEKTLELAETEEVEVEADPELLARIFQNVVSNCLRYAESCVKVQVFRRDAGTEIRVTDDGPGFLGEELEHVFDRYYKGRRGGFGIGLSIVKSGMRLLGGRAEAENRTPPEHGAIFRLWLEGEKRENAR